MGGISGGAVGAWVTRASRPGSPVHAREVGLAAALLAVLGAIAFAPHVRDGGFYNDDWAFSTTYRYRPHGGVIGAMQAFSWMSFRPLAMVWWPLNHGLFGTDPFGHLAMAAGFAVLVSVGVFLVLRMLGMASLHAGAVSALVLLFPAGDASKLWAAAAIALPAIAAYLFGTAVALRGLRSTGATSWMIHAGAVSLYLVSVLTYEVASGAVLVSILIYRLRTTWRRAASRWLVDVAVIIPVNLLVTSSTWNHPQPIATQIRHVATMIAGGVVLIGEALVPLGGEHRRLLALMPIAIGIAGFVAWRRMSVGTRREALGRWLATGVAGVVAAGAGYLTFIPADPGSYSPLLEGQSNRVNILASIGLVLAAYSAAMVLVLLLTQADGDGAPRALASAAGVTLLLALGYGVWLRDDISAWDRSAAAQAGIVNDIARAFPQPPAPGTSVFAIRHLVSAGGNIPVFAARWDLAGAVMEHWDDPSLRAYPMVPGSWYVCGPSALTVHNYNDGYGGPQSASYGRAVVVDVADGTSAAIGCRAACLAATAGLPASPSTPTQSADGSTG